MRRGLFGELLRRAGTPPPPLSRRAFLRASAAAGAGLLLSAAAPPRRPGGARVGVIGAGLAGLSCAHELQHVGAEVTVFEARRRPGGRVLSLQAWPAAGPVEAGGEFIGAQHHAWGSYAQRFGLALAPVASGPLAPVTVLGGRPLDAAAAAALLRRLEAAVAPITAAAAAVDPAAPWAGPQAAAHDARSVAAVLDAQGLDPACRRALGAELEGTNGAALAQQSYLALLAAVAGGGGARYWTDSDGLRCRGGNAQLPQALAAALRRGVEMGRRVVRLTPRGAGVVLLDGSGREATFDAVVVAVPASTWPALAGLPAPPGAPQMGRAVKYLTDVGGGHGAARPHVVSDGPVTTVWTAAAAEALALTCFSGGPAADACRRVAADEREAFYAAQMAALVPGCRPRPGVSRFFDWSADPLAGAAYACPAPGEVCRLGPWLAATHGAVDFAGEHCHYGFIGYMEGALRSGAAVAQRLARRLGLAVG